MKHLQLVFPSVADAGDFLAANKLPNAEMNGAVINGFFTDSEVHTAITDFGAKLEDYTPTEEVPESEPVAQHHPVAGIGWAKDITLVGKSGIAYNGTIFSKNFVAADLPAHAIICLANSFAADTGWQHAINAIYQTNNVLKEIERFNHRADLTHMIVLPVKETDHNESDKVDDLIRNYIHR